MIEIEILGSLMAGVGMVWALVWALMVLFTLVCRL